MMVGSQVRSKKVTIPVSNQWRPGLDCNQNWMLHQKTSLSRKPAQGKKISRKVRTEGEKEQFQLKTPTFIIQTPLPVDGLSELHVSIWSRTLDVL